MKIIQMVPYFYPAWAYGGPGKIVHDPSIYFSEKGHKVIVYTSDAYDVNNRMPKNKRYKDSKNLKVYFFKNISNTLAYKYNIFVTPGLFIRALIDIPKIDIVHIHDLFTIQNVWVGFLCRLFKKPYLISVHGCLEEARLKEKSIFKKWFLRIFGISFLKNASLLVATSKQEITNYSSLGFPKTKIVLIGHGIDASEFITRKTTLQSRKMFNLPNDKFIATYLGRIHKIKGLDLLVKGIKFINNPKIFIVIAGPNDGYLDALKELIKYESGEDRVMVLPGQFGEKRAQLLKASDIMVQPSYSEGFSLALLEYASIGKPMVITKGCHFEKLGERKAGLVVAIEPKSIAQGINYMYENPKKRKEFSRNAALLIKEKYSIEVIGSKLLNFYRSVL